jgi:uncharacterized iron-regulated membrane protein
MPESIEKGATYSGIASGILIILLISGVLLEIKRVYIKKKK